MSGATFSFLLNFGVSGRLASIPPIRTSRYRALQNSVSEPPYFLMDRLPRRGVDVGKYLPY